MSEPMEAFAEFQSQGKIRFGGVSNSSIQQMQECLETFPIVTNKVAIISSTSGRSQSCSLTVNRKG